MKVLISACLLGYVCRYDGKIKRDETILQRYKNDEIVPFCPEDPLFGTPRERISVRKIDGENRVFTDISKKDVTQLLKEETQKIICDHNRFDQIVLKSKSPSCGVGSTPILDENGDILEYSNGICAQMLIDSYGDTLIMDELLPTNNNKII